jgi:hypothetical protein
VNDRQRKTEDAHERQQERGILTSLAGQNDTQFSRRIIRLIAKTIWQ